MGLQLATYARATVTGLQFTTGMVDNVSNTSEQEIVLITVSAADAARFPTIDPTQPSPATNALVGAIDDSRYFAPNLHQYFHVVMRYEEVGDITPEDRLPWIEFFRVIWVDKSSGVLTALRSTGEVTNRPTADEWVVAEGDSVSVTLVMLAPDLAIARGVVRAGLVPVTDNQIGLGTSSKRFSRVRAHSLEAHEYLEIGNARINALASNRAAVLHMPAGIAGGSDEDNTLVLGGDQKIDGCLVGSLCIVRGEGTIDNYPMTGGAFGDVISIVQWVVNPLETRVRLVTQNKEFLGRVFGDDYLDGEETRRTLTINSVQHIIRNIDYLEGLDDTGGHFVVMNAEFPNSVSLEAFNDHLNAQNVDGYAKIGLFTSQVGYIDEATITGLRGLRADYIDLRAEQVVASKGLTIPMREDDPTEEDDTTRGFQVGSTFYSHAGRAIFVCVDATEGAAVWENLSRTVTRETLFSGGTNGVYDQRVTLTVDAGRRFSQYTTLHFGSTRMAQSEWVAGASVRLGTQTPASYLYYVSDTTFEAYIREYTENIQTGEGVGYRGGDIPEHERRYTYPIFTSYTLAPSINISGVR